MSKKYVTLGNIYLKKDFVDYLDKKENEGKREFLEEALGNISIIVDNYYVNSLEVNGMTPLINDKGKTKNFENEIEKIPILNSYKYLGVHL